jgi:hypothetical protein
MFVWWFIGSIGKYRISLNTSVISISFSLGCLFVGIVHCQEDGVKLADLDGRHEDVKVGLSVHDGHSQTVVNDTNKAAGNEGIATTTPTPEPFSCHECIGCNPKSEFATRVCEAGVMMCYVSLFL